MRSGSTFLESKSSTDQENAEVCGLIVSSIDSLIDTASDWARLGRVVVSLVPLSLFFSSNFLAQFFIIYFDTPQLIKTPYT